MKRVGECATKWKARIVNARNILTAIALLLAAAAVALPQTVHTFCAQDLPCSVSAIWTHSAQLVSTVATGTAPFSIASTTTVANLSAQFHNGKVAPGGNIVGDSDTQTLTNKTLTSPTITTPVINGASTGTGIQGTDSTLLTAGTVSASAGVALCTDGNHGATTSGCAAGGVSEAAWPAFIQNYIGNSAGYNSESTLFPSAHTLIRFTISLNAAISGCTTAEAIAFRDMTSSTNLATLSLSNGSTFFDSGALNVAMTAGHQFGYQVTTTGIGCTFPSEGGANVFYK